MSGFRRVCDGAWPLPDPAKFTGTPTERATLLNELYASSGGGSRFSPALPFASLDRMALKARLDEIGDSRASGTVTEG